MGLHLLAQPPDHWTTQAELNQLAPNQVVLLNLDQASVWPTGYENLPALQGLDLNSSSLKSWPTQPMQLPALRWLLLGRTWQLDHHSLLASLNAPLLERLSLKYCNLNQLPMAVCRHTGLKTLNLELNQLQNLPPELEALTQLEELSLSVNPYLTRLPDVVTRLTGLKRLLLDQTPLQELPPSLGNLTQLMHLNLAGTPLRQLPANLGKLTHLTRLNLAGCTNLDWNQALFVLYRLKNLRSLVLNDNNLSGLKGGVGLALSLDSLQAGNCNSLSNLLPTLVSSTGLVYLNVQRTDLGPYVAELCRLHNLRELDLSALDLKSLPPQMAALRELRILNLQYNDLSVDDFDVLRLLPNLQVLYISYGKYTDTELQALQRKLPQVVLQF